MGHAAVATNRGKGLRVFDPRNLVRTVAEKRPSLRQSFQYLRPVFETGAADDPNRNMLRSEALQCLDEFTLAKASCELAAQPDVGLRRRHGILIAEKVSNQR